MPSLGFDAESLDMRHQSAIVFNSVAILTWRVRKLVRRLATGSRKDERTGPEPLAPAWFGPVVDYLIRPIARSFFSTVPNMPKYGTAVSRSRILSRLSWIISIVTGSAGSN